MGTWLVILVLAVGWVFGTQQAFNLGATMTIIWLITEITKKNGFYTLLFTNWEDRQVRHKWQGAKAEGTVPRMSNLVISGPKDFTLLIGIWVVLPFGIEWFHTYGAVKSSNRHVVIRTWLGKGPAEFVYLAGPTKLGGEVFPTELFHFDRSQRVQKLTPDVTHTPHWYQRWPLYLWG